MTRLKLRRPPRRPIRRRDWPPPRPSVARAATWRLPPHQPHTGWQFSHSLTPQPHMPFISRRIASQSLPRSPPHQHLSPRTSPSIDAKGRELCRPSSSTAREPPTPSLFRIPCRPASPCPAAALHRGYPASADASPSFEPVVSAALLIPSPPHRHNTAAPHSTGSRHRAALPYLASAASCDAAPTCLRAAAAAACWSLTHRTSRQPPAML